MSKSKHTPGPWFQNHYGICSEKFDIAVVDVGRPEVEANIRLFAAAPELAESLLELILTLRMGDTDPDVRRARLETACAVYAKATGGSSE